MSPRRPRPTVLRRIVSGVVALVVLAGLAVVNRPMVAMAAATLHDIRINMDSYKQRYGHWSMLPVPPGFRVNAIHAALLRTGKVLIVAGSGNNRDQFEAKTFRTVLWDPATDRFQEIPTPTDVFCAGHTFLPDGNLLIAGGTKSYEILKEKVTHAAGVMKIKNEYPTGDPRWLPKGTRLVADNGQAYRTRADVTVPPATVMKHTTPVL